MGKKKKTNFLVFKGSSKLAIAVSVRVLMVHSSGLTSAAKKLPEHRVPI